MGFLKLLSRDKEEFKFPSKEELDIPAAPDHEPEEQWRHQMYTLPKILHHQK